MIHVFGDSWGFSYTPGAKFNDDISGKSLAQCLSDVLATDVINYAQRGLDNAQIVAAIAHQSTNIAPGDTVIVLQTDPLRNLVCSWHPDISPNGYEFLGTRSIHTVCDDVVDNFYSKLTQLQLDLKVSMLVHGGCSKLNQDLIIKHGLKATAKTSTEIICPEFEDTYYYLDQFVLYSHEKLKTMSDQYEFSKQQVLDLLTQVKQKEILWKARPDVFALNHTTEAGTQLVAEHIALQLPTYNTTRFRTEFEATETYQQLQADYKNISFESSFRDYLVEFDNPNNIKRQAWETKSFTPREGYTKIGSYFSAVPFYYLGFLLAQRPESVADIGCGGNHFKKYIPQITGYDVNPRADVKAFFDASFARDNEGKFDAAFSICSIHYVSIDLLEQRVSNFAKIIKPGGRGFVAMNYQRLLDSTSDPKSTVETIQQIRTALNNVNVKCLVLDILATQDSDTHDSFLDGNIRFVFENYQKN